MAFEVFDKRQSSLAKAPTVTIQKRGLMSLNRAAYNMINAPATVELLYYRDANIVGIRAASEDMPHAYSVRSQGDRATGPAIVAGTAFCQFYGIDTTISRRWTPAVTEGILCVDLSTPGAEIIGNRTPRSVKNVTATATTAATKGVD